MMTNVVSPTSIKLIDGSYVDLMKPDSATISIETIAYSLSLINRFNGHTIFPVSVAQHSVLVSFIVPPAMAMCGLLHDAHEAIVGDVASPLKRAMRERCGLASSPFDQLSDAWEKRIAELFGLPYPHPAAIKAADLEAIRIERRDAISHDGVSWGHWGVRADDDEGDFHIEPITPRIAEASFLARYRQILRLAAS